MNVDPGMTSVLVERARRLARPIVDEGSQPSSSGVLCFRVGSEALALATDAVAEVQAAPRPAPLPGQPAWMAGMVGVHGRILPAVWLDRFLADGAGAEFADAAERAIVLQANGVLVALLATAITGMAPGPESEPRALPAGLSPVGLECAIGIHREHLVLDASRLVHAIGEALGSPAGGAQQSHLIEASEGDGSHANRT